MNFLYFLGSEALGWILLLYAKWITDNTQRLDFAERYLGPTGTYTFYKIVGVGFIGFGFYALFQL